MKLTRKEMLQFNDDCMEACYQCPQYKGNWDVEDRTILLKEISSKKLIKHWLKSTVLWKSGYSELLSLDAKDIFDEFKNKGL